MNPQRDTVRIVSRALALLCLVVGATFVLLPATLWLVPLLDPTTSASTTTPTDSPWLLSAIGGCLCVVGLILRRVGGARRASQRAARDGAPR